VVFLQNKKQDLLSSILLQLVAVGFYLSLTEQVLFRCSPEAKIPVFQIIFRVDRTGAAKTSFLGKFAGCFSFGAVEIFFLFFGTV